MDEEEDISFSQGQYPTPYARGLDVMASLLRASSEEEIGDIIQRSRGNVPSRLSAEEARGMTQRRQAERLDLTKRSQESLQMQRDFANRMRMQTADLERRRLLLDMEKRNQELAKDVAFQSAMNQVNSLDPQAVDFDVQLKQLKMKSPDVMKALSDPVHGAEFYKTHIAPAEEQNKNIVGALGNRLKAAGVTIDPVEFVKTTGSYRQDGSPDWERIEGLLNMPHKELGGLSVQQEYARRVAAEQEQKRQEFYKTAEEASTKGVSISGKPGGEMQFTAAVEKKKPTEMELVEAARKIDPTGAKYQVSEISIGTGLPKITAIVEGGEKGVPLSQAYPDVFSQEAQAGVTKPNITATATENVGPMGGSAFTPQQQQRSSAGAFGGTAFIPSETPQPVMQEAAPSETKKPMTMQDFLKMRQQAQPTDEEVDEPTE